MNGHWRPLAVAVTGLLSIGTATGCSHHSSSSQSDFCTIAVGSFRRTIRAAELDTAPINSNASLANLDLLLHSKPAQAAPPDMRPAVATLKHAAAEIKAGNHDVLSQPTVNKALNAIETWSRQNCAEAS